MRSQKLLILIACLTAAPVRAESAHLDRVLLLRHGLYHTVRDETKPEVHTRQGFSVTVKDMKFVSEAGKVPACLGSTFGYEVLFVGSPAGALVPVKLAVIPPRPLLDPAVEQPIPEAVQFVDATMGATRADTYKFDYDWEVIKGTWTFQVWQDNRLMLEDKFDVTGDCGGVSSLAPHGSRTEAKS